MRKTLTSCVLVVAFMSMCLPSIASITRTSTNADDVQLKATTPSVLQSSGYSSRVLSGLSKPVPKLTETMPKKVQMTPRKDPVAAKQTYKIKGTAKVKLLASKSSEKVVQKSKKLKVSKLVTASKPKTASKTASKRFKKRDLRVASRSMSSYMSRSGVKPHITDNPYSRTYLSVSQFNEILDGTGLEGHGKSYYKLEQEYGVNGVFAISVAFWESGYGRKLANDNNFYGMRGSHGWLSFSSPTENIAYFGELMMRDTYTSKPTLSGIGSVYCPETYNNWASNVRSIMHSSYEKVS